MGDHGGFYCGLWIFFEPGSMSQVGSKSMASNILATSGSPCTPCSRQVELDGMHHMEDLGTKGHWLVAKLLIFETMLQY